MATTQSHQQRQSVPVSRDTALVASQSTGAPSIVRWGMDRDQLDLLKRTLAKGTSDDEFALFMNTAVRLGLDPFARQIYAVMRYDKREDRKVMSIQLGIDGFRATAMRTGEVDGQEGPFWCGDDGSWAEAWLHDTAPAAAKVIVYRKGCARPFVGVATYRSYVQTGPDGKPNAMWSRGPDFMLAKCAEALALRKAFPAELAGLYAPEEVDYEAEAAAVGVGRLPDVAVVKGTPAAAKPAGNTVVAQAPAPASSTATASSTTSPTPPPVAAADMTEAEANEIEKLIVQVRTEGQLKALFRDKIAPRAMAPALRERLIRVFGDQKQLITEAAKAELGLVSAEPMP